MKPQFIPYDKSSPSLPPERKLCLVLVAGRSDCEGEAYPETIAVGFLRYSGPNIYWVVPGVGGPVACYADCLGDDFPAREMWSEIASQAGFSNLMRIG